MFYVVLFGSCVEANGSLHDMAWQQAILPTTPVRRQMRCHGRLKMQVPRLLDAIMYAGTGDFACMAGISTTMPCGYTMSIAITARSTQWFPRQRKLALSITVSCFDLWLATGSEICTCFYQCPVSSRRRALNLRRLRPEDPPCVHLPTSPFA